MEKYRWTPSREVIANSNLTAFLREVGERDFESLSERAYRQPAWFWEAVLQFADIRFFKPYQQMMDNSQGLPWVKWCVGGETNLALNCLDRHRGTEVYQKEFLVWEGEDGELQRLSYQQFDRLSCRVSSALERWGIDAGDVCGLYLPLIPEALIAYFGVVRLGAVVMPLFSGFGPQAVRSRLELAGAKVLFTADGGLRRGKRIEMKKTADQAAEGLEIRQVVVSRLGDSCPMQTGRDVWWEEFLASGREDFPTRPMPTEAPAVLHFTSGTTGKPKGCVYDQVGLVVKMALDHGILNDFRESDRHFCMADMGWMVGSKLATLPTLHGGSLLLAEGLPDYPTTDRYWRLMAEHGVTFVELAPALIRQMMAYGEDQVKKHDLSRLRMVISGGEPWTERAWNWLFEVVGQRRVPILNSAGGTEVSGSILLCDLHHPLKVGSFSIAIPGMGADVVDEAGQPVPVGMRGELVLKRHPMGLTRGLWNNPERYLENYWERIPGLWVHGDYASRDEDGHWFLHGRSDDTMKVAGKRMGPAEIENAAMNSGKLKEVAVVGIPDKLKGTKICMVCVPLPGNSDLLKQELTNFIQNTLGSSMRPHLVLVVEDLPKTRNMKIMRRAVRAALTEEDLGDTSSLLNQEAIDAIRAVYKQQANQ